VQPLDVALYNPTSLFVIPLENRGNRRINPAAEKLITFKYRLLNTVSSFSQRSDLHLILSHLCAADKFS
jgi:hypothetical protein